MRLRFLSMWGGMLVLAAASCAKGGSFTGVGGSGAAGGNPAVGSTTPVSSSGGPAGSGGSGVSSTSGNTGASTNNSTSVTSVVSSSVSSTSGGCPTPCKLTAPQCGCPGGEQCGIDNATASVACVQGGTDGVGQQCGTSATDLCAPGGTCVTASVATGLAICDKFCDTDANCTAPGGLCIIQLNDGTGGSIPNVTLCSANCDPSTNVGCSAPGSSCQLLQESSGLMRTLTDCRGAGTKTYMAACDPTLDECAATYGCFNIGTVAMPQDVCLKYCKYPNGNCGAQTCLDLMAFVGTTDYGVCF
jgi:hypothetical protein